MSESFDRYPYLKHSTAEPPKVKLTFEEWYAIWYKSIPSYRGFINRNDMERAWNAAQENK